jgi:transposase-like protein
MKRSRKNYTPEEKVAILRRHLLDHVPVSDLCEELNLQPSLFYRWQKEFFENGVVAFQPNRSSGKSNAAEKKIGELEAKLKRKNEVVAELMEEHIQLKKNLGEL